MNQAHAFQPRSFLFGKSRTAMTLVELLVVIGIIDTRAPTHYASGQDWGDNEGLYSGFDNDNHRSTHPFWPLRRDEAGQLSIGSFGSAHGAGAQFVTADGSVQTLACTVDQRTFRHLGYRRDGQHVEMPQ